jgi:hypothetical protein
VPPTRLFAATYTNPDSLKAEFSRATQ